MKITEEELKEIIEKASTEGARAAVQEMRKQKMYREGMNTYQKTEYILKNYNDFKRAVKEREEKISDITMYGTKKKSCSVTTYPGGTRCLSDEQDKADEQIAILEHQNDVTRKMIAQIDTVLEGMRDEMYFEIIPKYYFEGKKYEVIAGELGVSNATVSAYKKTFINKIKIMLFSDSVIAELLA